MTQLTNEQIIDGMAKAMFVEPSKNRIEDVKSAITYLSSIGYQITKIEPDITMKRALLKELGYDPDADESTLDMLGQVDIATAGRYLRVYKLLSEAGRVSVKK